MDISSRDREALVFMKQFTNAYEAAGDDIYRRELDCLAVQFSFAMLAPRENDLFAGRRREAPIGFQPQNSFNSVGYYCNEPVIQEMIASDDFSEDEKDELRQLLSFWKGRTTCDKIFHHYPEKILTEVTHEDFNTSSGFGFNLYRMAGAQMDPGKLLENGVSVLKNQCVRERERNPVFFDAMAEMLTLFGNVCLAYADLCETALPVNRESSEIVRVLRHISSAPPKTMREALQLSYLYYLFSGTYNYGRMDDYLGVYYCRDLEEGRLTEEKALAMLCSLWRLMDERETLWDSRVILGGAGRKHPIEADRFCYLAMEASRIVRGSCPQLTLRMTSEMDPAVYEKALSVIGEGTTYPILYQDSVNIPAAAAALRTDLKTAEQYVPFGCGEYVIYNQSFGTPSGAINLLHGLNECIYGKHRECFEQAETFEDFYREYMTRVSEMAGLLAMQEKIEYDVCAQDAPYLMYSLLFDDCMQRALPVFGGGVRYLGGTLETYGNTNTADSLTAIRSTVFETGMVTKQELQKALAADFDGFEDLRDLLLSQPKYGNDLESADELAVQLHEDVCRIIESKAAEAGLHSYLTVIINNSLNTTFGLNTGASADGRHANTFMANANNPMNGMDKNGITAMLNSLLKLRPEHHAGSVQNMRFSREMFGRLLPKTKALLASYFSQGGTQAMISVLGRGELEDAMQHPEAYPDLIVRVGGFSARFIDLDKSVQLELLSRTLY